MDGHSDDVAVLSSERSSEAADILASVGPWRVREIPMTQEKLDYIWTEVQKSPSLFSDLTQHRAHTFLELVRDPSSYWLEAIDTDDNTVGIVYVTDLGQIVDANIHLMFFDRNLTNKGELVKEMIEIVFNKFPALHRLTALIPDIFFATKRLAIRSGLVFEGKRRQALLIGGSWIDEIIYGILAKEALSGTH